MSAFNCSSKVFNSLNSFSFKISGIDLFAKSKKSKEGKGKTKDISLNFFQEGLSVDEIAEKRGLVSGTIQGHLAYFVKEGIITTERLISSEKQENILTVISKINSTSSSAIKEKLGSEYSYGDIRIVLAHHFFANSKNETADSDS